MSSRSEAGRSPTDRRLHEAGSAHRDDAATPRSRWALALAACLSVLAVTPAFAADVPLDPERLASIDGFLARSTAPQAYTGAVALIAHDGRVVYERARGYRDLARKQPIRMDAIFRIYSMTKPVTTVAVLMLMEEGRLGLDDPVSRYLPEFAAMRRFTGGTADAPRLAQADRPITLRHLLTHTAGFATGGEGIEQPARLLERAALQDSSSLEEYARRLARVPLADEPGTRFRYDGVNTEVLARVVEVVGGERFSDFLQRRIFAPLDMRDTGFSVPASQRQRIVDLTRRDAQGRLSLADTRDALTPGERLRTYDSGAGGLYSTARDYLHFAQMLAEDGRVGSGRLLSRKTVDLMMSDQLAGFDPALRGPARGEGFGLGGYVVTDVAQRGRLGSVGQFGWSGVASTYFTVDRREHLVALLLCQHLPDDRPGDLPRLSVPFFNLVYQAMP